MNLPIHSQFLPGRTRVLRLPPPGTMVLRLPDPSVPVTPWPFGRAAGRLGDRSQAPVDAHGCPACPHPVIGPAIIGSPDVFINDRPALRSQDNGIHAACCGPNTWVAGSGSASVFINGRSAHRKDDPDQHCGGNGKLMEGSGDVFFG